jgi:hypothetical protein
MNHDFGAMGDLVCGAGATLGLRQFSLLAKCRPSGLPREWTIVGSSAAVGTPVVTVFGSGFPEWFAAGRDGHRIVFRRIYLVPALRGPLPMGRATLFAVDHQWHK